MDGPERQLLTILLPGQVRQIRECLQILVAANPQTKVSTVIETAKKISELLH